MTALIPMAGEGSRFRVEGYSRPKPLIEVSGTYMIVQAARSLPAPDRWVFICRKEHVEIDNIDKVLKEEFRNSEVIVIDYLTEGQASTCLLAEGYLKEDEPLVIGACDNGMVWDKPRFEAMTADENVDAIIWTFRNNVTVKKNPQMYGWVETYAGGRAGRVSCKVPVSDNPVNDHAIVGTFYFKRAGDFVKYAKRMIQKDRRINNEFYVDEVMNELIEDGLGVYVFEVDKYICWGTPNDLRKYQYWESYFTKALSAEGK